MSERRLTLADGRVEAIDAGAVWCGPCEHLDHPITKPYCKLFDVVIERAAPVNGRDSNGRTRCNACLDAEQAIVIPRSELARMTARIAELEKIVALGDELCVAAIRCGIHTWQSIPPDGKQRAVAFGFAMMAYHNASPTCEWPQDVSNYKPKTLDALGVTKGKVAG